MDAIVATTLKTEGMRGRLSGGTDPQFLRRTVVILLYTP